jgi:hypothetical protein
MWTRCRLPTSSCSCVSACCGWVRDKQRQLTAVGVLGHPLPHELVLWQVAVREVELDLAPRGIGAGAVRQAFARGIGEAVAEPAAAPAGVRGPRCRRTCFLTLPFWSSVSVTGVTVAISAVGGHRPDLLCGVVFCAAKVGQRETSGLI